MEEVAHVVPDTNVLLHYKFFEIVWRKILPASVIHIHICPAVLEEVTSAKDMGDRKALRKRAASLVRKFSDCIAGDRPHKLRAGEFLHFITDEPDFQVHESLDHRSKDDHILASALDLQVHLEQKVIIATADTSLKLRLRLPRFGLTHFELPSSARLELADEDDRKIRELVEENQRLLSSQPILTATFAGRERVLSIKELPSESIEAEAKAKSR